MRVSILLMAIWITAFSNAQEYFPKNDGVKQTFKNYIAITNATIYLSPNEKIEKATLLIKEGKIVDLGEKITLPKSTYIIDGKDKTIYPSFIDLYSEFGIEKPQPRPNGNFTPQYDTNREGYYWNDHIKPEYNAYENTKYDTKKAEELRKIGFGTLVSHHNDGIIAGTGFLWTLNDNENNSKRILQTKISQHFTFSKSKFTKQNYPSSLMGSMALIRQVYHDASWYAQGTSQTKDLSLESFNTNKNLLQIFNAGDVLSELRALKIAKEFNVNYLVKGNGEEFLKINEIKNTGAIFIIPLDFPDAYDVSDPYLAQQISLADMKFWNQAPYNLKILADNNISFVLTSFDNKKSVDFLTNLKKAVSYGLPKEKAIAALTTLPAQLMGQEKNLGQLKKGYIANFIITSGDLFEEKTKIYENWVQGNRYEITSTNENDLRGNYTLTFNNLSFDLAISGEADAPKAKIKKDSIEFGTQFTYKEPWINIVIKTQDTLTKSFYRLSGTKINETLQGKVVLENGNETTWIASKRASNENQKEKEEKEEKNNKNEIPAMLPVTFPNMAYGNTELPLAQNTLFKNATVWTGEKEGILKDTDVLVENGKIVKIAKNIQAPQAVVIDATGKHLTAGIIDEHSHIAISRGVNEGGQNSSAEVTIEDVVNSDDINIYRNLSGGVTAANLLHGSANPIGGRAAFIKLKWGYSPEKMLVNEAPKYIKFALGENVKQSNWGSGRFPQTRMGVEQVYEDYFSRAQAYQKEWNQFKNNKSKNKISPRYDIEMEVLSEILNKKRFITCHSYVQSEINMLMKLTERFGFRIQTFTHILEGYKLADKMATHGVGGSTFADWWGYKYEVKDAIPYNAALMNGQGVVVSINSDDAEMSRRLNQEAAKAVKYGNVSEETAWNFVTLNPAKLLQVDDKVGSIKIGKDADLVLWSDNPLSIYAKAEKTMIEGIVFYDIEKEKEKRAAIIKERSLLINKLLEAKNKGLKTQAPKKKETGHYHCNTIGEQCIISHARYK